MTPKEKAQDLVNRIYWKSDEFVSVKASKEIAIICVDEIIKSENLDLYFDKEEKNRLEFTSDDAYIEEVKIKYWYEVKQEICDL